MTPKTGPIWLAGAGNMGSAMLRGWLDGGTDPDRITVIRPSGAEVAGGVRVVTAPPVGEGSPAIVVLAMKPQKLDDAATALAAAMDRTTLLVSVLAGVEVASLASRFPQRRAIVRIMPNTPAAIGKGVALLHASDPQVKSEAEALAAPLGLTEWIDDETIFGAATSISGCGPAFLFRFIEALAKAGEALGVSQDQAVRLALATVEGAACLAARSPESPATLADRVASPGGSTRAGLDILDANDAILTLLAKTLAASTRRNEEMAHAARQA